MKKRIYRNMYLLTLFCVILTTVFSCLAFYNLLNNQIENEVKSKAILIQKSLDWASDNPDFIKSLDLARDDERISIVAPDGNVVFDSYKGITTMENHLDRPEVSSAFLSGVGESYRFSETLGERTYYYAIKLNNNTVLRLAKTSSSIYMIFSSMIPTILLIIILIFVLCNFLARRLTKKIIEPINNFYFAEKQHTVYEELSPFIRTIMYQKEQINEQTMNLEDKSNTITAITHSMKEGLIILDKNGVILLANRSAVTLFDNMNTYYTGKNILELTRDTSLLDCVKTALTGNGCDIILTLRSKTMQAFLNPVFSYNDVTGAIILFLDITENFNTEKIRREFSANVSHELKTPLTTILGLSEMIDRGMAKEEDIKGFGEKIKDEANRLINLIEDIIKLSELDEKMGGKQFEEFSLLSLVKSVVDNLTLTADEKGVELEIIGDDFEIVANKAMCGELLFNLIDNGIKYNKQNGSVKVTLSKEKDKTKIGVSDTGIGIPKQHIDRIFERFYRVDKSRSKKTGGTGLGLSIVKHVVGYHDGEINIGSNENVGTTVVIYI